MILGKIRYLFLAIVLVVSLSRAAVLKRDTVHFIGGVADPCMAIATPGGGCTKAAWDADPTISTWMGRNGEPLVRNIDPCVTDSGQQYGLGYNCARLTRANIGDGVTAGTLIYVGDFITGLAGGYTDATLAIIMGVDTSGNWVDIDLTYAATDYITGCYIGGAYTSIEKASTAIDDCVVTDEGSTSHYANRYVYTNLDEATPGNIAWGLDGSTEYNRHIYVEGYGSSPGDMDGKSTCFIDGETAAAAGHVITITENLGGDLFTLDGVDNVQFKNIYFKHGHASTDELFEMATDPEGIRFIDCKFGGSNNNAGHAIKFDGFGHQVLGCHFTKTFTTGVMSCVLQADSEIAYNYIGISPTNGDIGMINVSYGMMIHHNVFEGDEVAITVYSRGNWIFNNTFIDCEKGIHVNGHMQGMAYIWNNIFDLSAVGDYAVYVDSNKGSVAYCDYNCAYSSTANAALTAAFYGAEGSQDLAGDNDLEEDPVIADPSNKDYRPMNLRMLIKGRPRFFTGKFFDRTRYRYQEGTYGAKY